MNVCSNTIIALGPSHTQSIFGTIQLLPVPLLKIAPGVFFCALHVGYSSKPSRQDKVTACSHGYKLARRMDNRCSFLV